MRIMIATVVLVLFGLGVAALGYSRSLTTDPVVERQAQVPAPFGAVWCKSADTCPRRR